MYKIDTFMEYWMLVDDRLVVTPEVSIRQIAEMSKELESVDKEYTMVFTVPAFASYKGVPECIANHIMNMETGTTCGFGDMEIRKLSKNLCVGVMYEVLYQYNDLRLHNRKPTGIVEEKPVEEEAKQELLLCC